MKRLFGIFSRYESEEEEEEKFTNIDKNRIITKKYAGVYEVDDTASVATTTQTPLEQVLQNLADQAVDEAAQNEPGNPTILQLMGVKKIEQGHGMVVEEKCNPVCLYCCLAMAVFVAGVIGAFIALKTL